MSIRASSVPQDNAEKQLRLVEEIRRVASMLGVDRLSQREFDRRHSLGGVSTVGYRFGSWNRAVVAAGLKPNPPGGTDREPELDATELLDEVLRLRDELKKLPSERELSDSVDSVCVLIGIGGAPSGKRERPHLFMNSSAHHYARRPNHALQRPRPSRSGCNQHIPWAGSLSWVVRPPVVLLL